MYDVLLENELKPALDNAIIVRQYEPDNERISNSKIISTIIDDFAMFYSIYLHIRVAI